MSKYCPSTKPIQVGDNEHQENCLCSMRCNYYLILYNNLVKDFVFILNTYRLKIKMCVGTNLQLGHLNVNWSESLENLFSLMFGIHGCSLDFFGGYHLNI